MEKVFERETKIEGESKKEGREGEGIMIAEFLYQKKEN